MRGTQHELRAVFNFHTWKFLKKEGYRCGDPLLLLFCIKVLTMYRMAMKSRVNAVSLEWSAQLVLILTQLDEDTLARRNYICVSKF